MKLSAISASEAVKLQFSAAEHLEGVGRSGLLHLERDVGQQFLVETVTQVAGGNVLAFPARERRVIDRERHGDRGFIDLDYRKRCWDLGTGDGFADGDALDAGNGEDVTGLADGFVNGL